MHLCNKYGCNKLGLLLNCASLQQMFSWLVNEDIYGLDWYLWFSLCISAIKLGLDWFYLVFIFLINWGNEVRFKSKCFSFWCVKIYLQVISWMSHLYLLVVFMYTDGHMFVSDLSFHSIAVFASFIKYQSKLEECQIFSFSSLVQFRVLLLLAWNQTATCGLWYVHSSWYLLVYASFLIIMWTITCVFALVPILLLMIMMMMIYSGR